MVIVLSTSLSEERDILINGYTLIPRKLHTFAYRYVLSDPEQIIRAYSVTIAVTTIGTLSGLLIMSLLAYALSRNQFMFRRTLNFCLLFTMLFSGGLVPFYILVTKYLNLHNSLAVLILPYLVSPWFVFLLRTFFRGLPEELIYSAKIDGASEFRIFFQIIIPLSKPALATVGLFLILRYWNDWWMSLLFIRNRKLHPIQLMLYNILMNIKAIEANPGNIQMMAPPAETVRMAMAVLAAGPVSFAFLFLQKYFVRGIMIGSLKG
jgi:putative aldouronate transport system permease protein